MVGSAWNNLGGTVTIKVEELTRPANDDIENASAIGALPYEDTVDLSTATRADDDTYCGNGETVWYTFVPSRSMRLELETEGAETAVSVYSGAPGSLAQLACQYFYYEHSMEVDVWAGETYYFMVAGAWNIGGDIVFEVHELPRNDDIGDRTVITALPFSETVDATYASWDSDDPTSCGWEDSPTIWYAYQPESDMRLKASVTRNVPYLGLSVYTGSPSNLQPVGCVDYQTQPLVFEADAGRTYFIMVAAAPDSAHQSILTFSLQPAEYSLHLPTLRR